MEISYGKNVLSNIFSQAFVAVVGIVMVPVLLQVMGAEAFGLIGFFSLMQAWFNLLDMGMTPTLSREAARFCGGALSGSDLRQLLRTMEGLFTAVGVAGALVVGVGSTRIATSWLHAEALSSDQVRFSIMLMGVVIALRWIGEVCRGAIAGFERMVWLGWFRSVIAAFRFILVIPFLIYTGGRPIVYFAYQAVLAVVELWVLRWKLYSLLPAPDGADVTLWNWKVVKPILGFSTSIAFTSSIWVLVTQLDKLVLSKVLPLSEFGYFTLAVVVASGIPLLSGPISAALLPRMTRLVAAGDELGMIRLYRDATQMVTILVVPAALLFFFFAPQVLLAWTGNQVIAMKAAPILRLYAIGNGILAVLAFQYYLQFAKGNLKLHVIGNLILVVALVPSVIWATMRYGTLGAGTVWAGVNALYLVLWAPLVHRRFLPGLHWTWLRVDIGNIFLPAALFGAVVSWVVKRPALRMYAGFEALLVGTGLLIVAVAGSSWGRGEVRKYWLGIIRSGPP